MVHVGAVTTDDGVALARHAAKIGADAVSCVTPIYYPATTDVTFEHYRRIGAATELPLFIYHLSYVNQLAIGPREYAERIAKLPRFEWLGYNVDDQSTFTDKTRLFGLWGAPRVWAQERPKVLGSANATAKARSRTPNRLKFASNPALATGSASAFPARETPEPTAVPPVTSTPSSAPATIRSFTVTATTSRSPFRSAQLKRLWERR